MEIFGNPGQARGCYARFNLHRAGKAVELAFQGHNLGSIPGLVVQSAGFVCRDTYSHIQCFDESNFSTAFGYDFSTSSATVSAVAMLIPGAEENVSGLPNILEFYDENRVYRNQQAGVLLIGGEALKVNLVGLSCSTLSDEYNLQKVDFELSLDARKSQRIPDTDFGTATGIRPVSRLRE
jgi:hypothetical protein